MKGEEVFRKGRAINLRERRGTGGARWLLLGGVLLAREAAGASFVFESVITGAPHSARLEVKRDKHSM